MPSHRHSWGRMEARGHLDLRPPPLPEHLLFLGLLPTLFPGSPPAARVPCSSLWETRPCPAPPAHCSFLPLAGVQDGGGRAGLGLWPPASESSLLVPVLSLSLCLALSVLSLMLQVEQVWPCEHQLMAVCPVPGPHCEQWGHSGQARESRVPASWYHKGSLFKTAFAGSFSAGKPVLSSARC